MSGLFGIYDPTGQIHLSAARQRARDFRLPGAAEHVIETVEAGGLLLGRYHLNKFPLPAFPAELTDNDPSIVQVGYAIPDSGPDSHVTLRGTPQGELKPLIESLDGAFFLASWEPLTQTLELAGDRFGLMPHYWLRFGSHSLCFASEYGLLFALLGQHPSLDRESVARWMELEYVGPVQTLFRDVTLFPPACHVKATRNSLTVDTYCEKLRFVDNPHYEFEEFADTVQSRLRKSINRRLSGRARVGISLSGGMDSRLIAAHIAESGIDATTFTFGFQETADFNIAAQVAKTLNLPHYRFLEAADTFWQALPSGVAKSGGLHNIADMRGLASLPTIAEHCDFVINGYGGNELFGFLSLDVLRMHNKSMSKPQFVSWLTNKLRAGWSDQGLVHIRTTLAPDLTSACEWISDIVTDRDNTPSVLSFYDFYTNERLRRINLLGVTMDSLAVEPILPLLDAGLVENLVTMPINQRLLARFYRRMFARQFPSLATIPYERTGLPITAGDLRVIVRRLRQLLSSRSHRAAPVGSLLRGALQRNCRDLLLTRESRLNDLLGADFINRTCEGYFTEERANSRLVTQLITLELLLRQFRPNTQ